MKVWSKSASISVTITNIWTKFGTEHKYHTTSTPEWPNSHKLKIQDGGGRHLEFRKNVNNFGLDILHQIIWEDAQRLRGEDNVTKSRNRKLICVTSSNERLKHSASISVTITDIWTKLVQISNFTLSIRRNGQIQNLKIQDAGCSHFGFLGYVKFKKCQ